MAYSDLRINIIRAAFSSASMQVVNRFISLLLGIILARALGPNQFGIYAYSFSMLGLLLIIAEAGIPTFILRETARLHSSQNSPLLMGLINNVIFINLITSLIIMVLVGCIITFVNIKATAHDAEVLMYAIFLIPFLSFSKILCHILMGMKKIAIAESMEMLVRPLLFLIFLTVIMSITNTQLTAQTAMKLQVFVALCISAYCYFKLSKNLKNFIFPLKKVDLSSANIRKLIPFILIGAASTLNSNIDIIMVGIFSSAENVGFYRVAVQCVTLVTFGLNVANIVLAPYFSQLNNKESKQSLIYLVRTSTKWIFISTLILSIFLMIFSEDLIAIFFSNSFSPSGAIVYILVLGPLVAASSGASGVLLYMLGHEKSMLTILSQSVCINLALNVILIPIFGVIGAAIATVLSEVFRVIRIVQIVRLKEGINMFIFKEFKL